MWYESRDCESTWVSTKHGPGEVLVTQSGIFVLECLIECEEQVKVIDEEEAIELVCRQLEPHYSDPCSAVPPACNLEKEFCARLSDRFREEIKRVVDANFPPENEL